MMQADVIVAHNGDKFDSRWLAGRILALGLAPLPPIQSIDTLKIIKKNFMLNANRLDYVGKYLGIGQKIKTSPGLWLRVLKGDPSAVKEMVKYNKGDISLLESVFNRIIPYLPSLNRRLFGQGTGCPKCGSTKVQRRGLHIAVTRTYQRYQCQNPACGGWFREDKPVTSTSARSINS